MILNIPESFFEQKAAIHVEKEFFEEFIDACWDQYAHRTTDNDTLLSWCIGKASSGHSIFIYFGGGRFTAFTEGYRKKDNYIILELDDVCVQAIEPQEILTLL